MVQILMPFFSGILCASALLALSAEPASSAELAVAPAIARCEAATAAAPGTGGEDLWNTAYVVPEYDGSHALVISTSNPTAIEAALITMLWKAGGNKVGGSDSSRPWAQPLQLMQRQFMIPSQMLACVYRGTWEIAPGKLAGVLKKLFDASVIELYGRQPNKLSFDRAEARRKLALLDRERAALAAEGTALPSILGLVDAERNSLRTLLDRYEAFKRTSQLDVCIKRG